MRVSGLGEDALVERIKGILDSTYIGDDTALVEVGGVPLLLTTDALREGVHFLRSFPISAVGWKAVSTSVSDVVACGGKPLFLLVSLALPDVDVSVVDQLYEGIKKACQFYSCTVVGGNITKSDKLGIDVFLLGQTQRFVARRGAKPKDGVYVSGTLGDAKAGLELLLMEKRQYEEFELLLIERHLRPTARIDYVGHISKYANACMDISDGLSTDANRLAKSSGVRLRLDPDRIPISRELRTFCQKHGKDPLQYALHGGEDYQLLFTHPESRYNPFLDMTLIGWVEEGEGVYLGQEPLPPAGFDHLREV
ncbi:thiamine-monophosphate kinase [Thermocrinis albus DSM 14484]|uniref:Thiamine-monophosphate kinase n=1 Tax=Thermocrinis albus (strain DSM 14484 / JCM 11386 / HI 11/12) TaxID=638303 RepID=D3SL70_THEAH|nr:thiamine-phosphate kinase [Thermocrinis albus]ADC89500.1 thiamine-monophosphate kinase [Thermocrinis albus DSM 14484]